MFGARSLTLITIFYIVILSVQSYLCSTNMIPAKFNGKNYMLNELSYSGLNYSDFEKKRRKIDEEDEDT